MIENISNTTLMSHYESKPQLVSLMKNKLAIYTCIIFYPVIDFAKFITINKLEIKLKGQSKLVYLAI